MKNVKNNLTDLLKSDSSSDNDNQVEHFNNKEIEMCSRKSKNPLNEFVNSGPFNN